MFQVIFVGLHIMRSFNLFQYLPMPTFSNQRLTINLHLFVVLSFWSIIFEEIEGGYFNAAHRYNSRYQSLFNYSVINNNKMSENQSESLANHPTDHKNSLLMTQFKQNSVRDQTISVNQLGQGPQQLKQQALIFFKDYQPIDSVFPVNSLKESKELKVKYYKESTYYGEVHNGKRHGTGVLVYRCGRVYEGEWMHDQKRGYAAEKFPNGSVYKGQYLNGKPSGTGTYIWGNGQRYDGQWINGFKHGSGMWRGQLGDSYKGQWKFGKPDGYGVHTWPNGDTYEGQFKQCLKHGEGLERFANGDMYKGSYANGKPAGYGEYYWFNGSFFKGNFVNGLREGKGVWKRSTGKSDSYDGQYRNDKKWGFGVFTWASGNVYRGDYEADMRNGYGQMFWKNGSYYKGKWVNGIQHGEGEIYVPQEGYKKGVFDNNKIVEVWEEKLQKVAPKTRIRVRTQNTFGKHNRSKITNKSPEGLAKSRSKENQKRMSEQAIRRKTSPSGAFGSRPKRPSKNNISEAMKEQNDNRHHQHHKSEQSKRVRRYLFEDKQSFNGKPDVVINRQRVSTSFKEGVEHKIIRVENTNNNSSKSRLLHSSFYLYKLNQRHIEQTSKFMKRSENQGNKAAIMFMGKLFPDYSS